MRDTQRFWSGTRRSTIALAVLALAAACIDLSDDFVYEPPSRPDDVSADFPPGPPAPWSGDTVRIATFNLDFFYDNVCDSGNCRPANPDAFEPVFTTQEFNARADEIAQAIRLLEADVVLLQEIENQVALDALLVRLADRYGEGAIAELPSAGSQNVAVLANARVIAEIRHRQNPIPLPDSDGTTTFVREFFEVHLAFSDTALTERYAEVIVFVAHFKSRFQDEPERRLAEAQAAREIVLSTAINENETLVVLGGDLNDTPGSPPIDALEEGGELLRVAAELAPAEQATLGTQAIDHLFFATIASGRYQPGSARVDRDATGGWGGSDHAALGATFVIDDILP